MASDSDESKPRVPSLVHEWGSKSTLTLTLNLLSSLPMSHLTLVPSPFLPPHRPVSKNPH